MYPKYSEISITSSEKGPQYVLNLSIPGVSVKPNHWCSVMVNA